MYHVIISCDQYVPCDHSLSHAHITEMGNLQTEYEDALCTPFQAAARGAQYLYNNILRNYPIIKQPIHRIC